tara:strand:- start:1035 stop:1568 length:534 start_codon:yes stop_codon:yes gene_type:complete
MIINRVIEELHKTGFRTVSKMRNTLNKDVRPGNRSPQSTTFRTSDTIRERYPILTGGFLLWSFEGSDTAMRLNTGGSNKSGVTPTDVPYGQFRKPGGQSNYIGALITWAQDKYGLNPEQAKRMAFKVANSASSRGRTVSAKGWLDDLKKELEDQILTDLNTIISLEVEREIRNILKA